MGDSSETIIDPTLRIRDCTCAKPECKELEFETSNLIDKPVITRLSMSQVENMQWFLDKWVKRNAQS